MTAELIVMNKNGLALAADSAVSISSGGNTAKVYNTANKLFALSKHHPVGVMFYGNAAIMGIPWEVVIKRYREALGETSFETLNEYLEDLLKYLKENEFFAEFCFTYMKHTADDCFQAVVNEIDRRVTTQIKEKGKIEESDIEKIHTEGILEMCEFIKEQLKRLKIPRKDMASSRATYRPSVVKIVNNLVGKRPIKGHIKRKLVDACLCYAIIHPSSNLSGVVVAGFGRADVFPSARAIETHYVLDSAMVFARSFSEQVELQSTAFIKAFAQSSETQSFMNGVSNRIFMSLNEHMDEVLAKELWKGMTGHLVGDGIIPAEKANRCTERLTSFAIGIHEYLLDKVRKISRDKFSGPVIEALEFFSPTEMATMAETLVSLESFKQKVTLRDETVGGPIDVAVITRGDGFIWMKRKHYFSPEPNHQFFNNYNRKTEGTNDHQDD